MFVTKFHNTLTKLFNLNLACCLLLFLLYLRKGNSQDTIVDIGCNVLLVDIVRQDKSLLEL